MNDIQSTSPETAHASINYAPVNIILAREEVLLILRLLDHTVLYGLDADPLGELTKEQVAYGLICAERSMRARGIARIDEENGNLLIQNDLLNALGICAFATQLCVVHHFSAEGQPDRLIAHRLGEQVVIHTNPGIGLHRFLTLSGRDVLLSELATACLDQPRVDGANSLLLQTSRANLSAAREAAASGNLEQVQTYLGGGNTNVEAISHLGSLLSQPHSVSIVHILTPQQGDEVASQEFTVLHNQQQAWLMVEIPVDKPEETAGQTDVLCRLSTLSTDQLLALLAQMIPA